jgi:tetratricopeptide (TPR) repeat protein
MKTYLVIAVTMAAFLFAIPAKSAVYVLGEGPERGCYLAAKTGSSTYDSLKLCDDAIDHSVMILHDRAATYVNRGVILLRLGRIDNAMSDFNTCMRVMPDLGDAYLNRGVAYITMKQYANALADIQKGIARNPSDMAVAYYDRAVAEEQLGQLRDAYLDYQAAAKEEPTFTEANEAVGRFRVITKARSNS